MSLLWPITKENRKGLHKRKPILTCPSETCPWERQRGAENPGREVSCTLSQDPESMAGRSRAWNPVCWAHFNLARHSCLSIFHILSSTANEKLHFSFRAKGRDEKRRLKMGRRNFQSRGFQLFGGRESMDWKSSPLAQPSLEAGEGNAHFWKPGLLPPK